MQQLPSPEGYNGYGVTGCKAACCARAVEKNLHSGKGMCECTKLQSGQSTNRNTGCTRAASYPV